MVKTGAESFEVLEALRALKKAYGKTKKAVWLRAAEVLSRSSRRRVEVNLYALEKYGKEGELVIVPGKILSLGKLSKKLTIAALSATKPARDKIVAAGGKLMTLREAADKGDSKNARILG
jgi:large subunit ribosomal protein L18e